MTILNLIPKSINDMFDKCRICMQTKITIKPFPKNDRSLFCYNLYIMIFVICIVILQEETKSIL
jgi:hypothetical protein